MDHTKEPWIEAGPSFGSGTPMYITSIVPATTDEYETQDDICCFDPMADKETNAANARRIVACVNACAGLKENELRSLLIIGTRMNELATQCDELLAALKDEIETVCNICLKNPYSMCNTCEGMCSRTMQMQNTIAKIEDAK